MPAQRLRKELDGVLLQMVPDQTLGLGEPEQRDLVQDLPLVGDTVGEDVIEG